MLCLQDGDYCTPDPCLHGGTCYNGADSYICVCDNGYHGIICETSTNISNY